MPLYAAHYETACMTRQFLEQLAGSVHAASGACRTKQLFVSFGAGHLVWIFSAPDRETLERWLDVLHMKNYQWLARLDHEGGEEGELRDL